MVLVIDEDRLRNAANLVLSGSVSEWLEDGKLAPEFKQLLVNDLIHELQTTRINKDGVKVKISFTY